MVVVVVVEGVVVVVVGLLVVVVGVVVEVDFSMRCPLQHKWFSFLLSHLMKEQNLGSFLALSASPVLSMFSAFVLCAAVASVTKAGKIISDSLELFSLCVSVVVVVAALGVVLVNLL